MTTSTSERLERVERALVRIEHDLRRIRTPDECAQLRLCVHEIAAIVAGRSVMGGSFDTLLKELHVVLRKVPPP